MRVREKSPADQAWIEALLAERWRSTDVVLGGASYAARRLPAWIAGPPSAGGRIAEIGHYGIPIRDEIELVLAFG